MKRSQFNSLFPATAITALIVVFAAVFSAGQALGQVPPDTESAAAAPQQAPALPPVSTLGVLKGVELGMTPDEVKDKLGKPDQSDKTSLYFEEKKGPSFQLKISPEGKVNMIAAIFSSDDNGAPKPEEVFGPEVKVEPGANGRIYKLVRYPDAGFWVAYSRIKLDKGDMTTVTMQRLRSAADSPK